MRSSRLTRLDFAALLLVEDTLCIPEQPLEVDWLLDVLLAALDNLAPKDLHCAHVRAAQPGLPTCKLAQLCTC